MPPPIPETSVQVTSSSIALHMRILPSNELLRITYALEKNECKLMCSHSLVLSSIRPHKCLMTILTEEDNIILCIVASPPRPRQRPFSHLLSLNDCRLHKFWLMIFWTINHDYINIVVYVTEFVDIFMLSVFLPYTISLLFFLSSFLQNECTSCNRKDISFYCQGVLSVAAVLQWRVPLSNHIYFMR